MSKRIHQDMDMFKACVVVVGPNAKELAEFMECSLAEIQSRLTSEVQNLKPHKQKNKKLRIKPTLNNGPFTELELQRLFEGRLLYNNDWAKISEHVETRQVVQFRCYISRIAGSVRKRIKQTELSTLTKAEVPKLFPPSQVLSTYEYDPEDEILLLPQTYGLSQPIFSKSRSKTAREHGFEAISLATSEELQYKSSSGSKRWTREDETRLEAAVLIFSPDEDSENWTIVARYMERSPTACSHRYQTLININNITNGSLGLHFDSVQLLRFAVATFSAIQTPLPPPLLQTFESRSLLNHLVNSIQYVSKGESFSESELEDFDSRCLELKNDLKPGDSTQLSIVYCQSVLNSSCLKRFHKIMAIGSRLLSQNINDQKQQHFKEDFLTGLLVEVLSLVHRGELEKGSTCEKILLILDFILEHLNSCGRRNLYGFPRLAVAASTLLYHLEKRCASGMGDAHIVLSHQVAKCARLAFSQVS